MNKKRIRVRKNPTVQQMFQERLLKEGRLEQYEQARARIAAETPPAEPGIGKILRGKAITEAAMKEFGFISSRHEKTLWNYERGEAERTAAGRASGEQCRTFDEALAILPTTADTQVEHEWILAHPALARKSRDPEKQVIITGNDLLDAKHGPCPSAAAANKLQYWANNPAKVYENLAVVMKKTDARESEGSERVVDDGISELEHAVKLLGAKE